MGSEKREGGGWMYTYLPSGVAFFLGSFIGSGRQAGGRVRWIWLGVDMLGGVGGLLSTSK